MIKIRLLSVIVAVAAAAALWATHTPDQTITEAHSSRPTLGGAPIERGPMPRDEAEERLFLAQLRYAEAIASARERARLQGRPYPPHGFLEPFGPRPNVLGGSFFGRRR